MANKEVRERYSRLLRMLDVFNKLGVPGIEVEILEAVVGENKRKSRKGVEGVPTITLDSYTGQPHSTYGLPPYRVVDRVKGWIIPEPKTRSDDRRHGNRSYDLRTPREYIDQFLDYFPDSIILTEDGRDWKNMITPPRRRRQLCKRCTGRSCVWVLRFIP